MSYKTKNIFNLDKNFAGLECNSMVKFQLRTKYSITKGIPHPTTVEGTKMTMGKRSVLSQVGVHRAASLFPTPGRLQDSWFPGVARAQGSAVICP